MGIVSGKRPSGILVRGAEAYVPDHRTLPILQSAVQECRGCDLYKYATQAVFGEGPRKAEIALIGEQPGNDEDLQGHPFVGPSGNLLNRALQDAAIERRQVYVTNVVKHFKFEERGKRRLHKKPRVSEMRACEPWLEAEMELVRPQVIVCLGATAAQALFGGSFKLTKERGVSHPHQWAEHVLATVHPSAILRMPDPKLRHEEYARFVEDLKQAGKLA